MAETTLITDDYRDYGVKSIDLDSGSVHPANTNLSASWNFSPGSLFYKTPVAADEVAIKSYVDAVAFGSRDPKDAVRVAASGNIALTGTFAVDGITLVTGDRVLAEVKQKDPVIKDPKTPRAKVDKPVVVARVNEVKRKPKRQKTGDKTEEFNRLFEEI